MARILDIFFNVHGVISKTIDGFCLCHLKIFCKILGTAGNTHTFSTASAGCLDHNRKTDLFCQFQTIISGINCFFRARNNRNFCVDHGVSCFLLISHPTDDFRGRSDESNVTLLTHLCKFCIFRQKSKSRMDGFCFGCNGCAQNPFHIQITVCRCCFSDTDGFVCQLGMQRVFICS